jgi:hypothetical protein
VHNTKEEDILCDYKLLWDIKCMVYCFIKTIVSRHENDAKEHELSDIFVPTAKCQYVVIIC